MLAMNNNDLGIHRAEVIDVCITEFDEKAFVESTRKERETIFAKLINQLLSSGKTDAALRVTTDVEYREELYLKYGIK